MSRTIVLVLLLGVCGCRQGFLVRTNSDVSVSGSLGTDATVTLEQGHIGSEPVVPIPVGTDCPADCTRVAVIDVDGILININFTGPYSFGENPVALFREKLDAVASDPGVGALVVRINSPGGSVTATDVMWHELRTFRERTGIPVVACLMDHGTGGAYYLATAADHIVAHPTSVVGGIGVILNLYNLRELMAQFNIIPQPVKSGENIDMGTSAKSLPEDVEAMFQAMADEYHERFKEVVCLGRPSVDLDGGTTFDGRVFTATQARTRGLIDQVGYLDGAVAMAKEMAGMPGAGIVFYRRADEPTRTLYATTPNVPLQSGGLFPTLPGLDRSKLPAFMYIWQAELTVEKLTGK